MSADWVNDYVGVPYLTNGRTRAGWDCWGLVMVVFEERRGIRLPDWTVDDPGPLCGEQTITRGAETEIGAANAIKVDAAEPWAIVLARRRTMAHHVGVVVGAGAILHCSRRSRGTACDPVDRFVREYHDVEFYRWCGHG
jgi:cell wall-associated NlpC family hydrolase